MLPSPNSQSCECKHEHQNRTPQAHEIRCGSQDCFQNAHNSYFPQAMAMENAQIPVEWVDAEEWEAIEQALAHATCANSILWGGQDEQLTTSAAVDSVHPHAVVEPVLKRVDNLTHDHPEIPRRTLPAWGQEKTTEEPTQAQLPQLRTKIEPVSNLKPVVVQTNLSRLTDSWAMARPACKEKVHSRSQYLQFRGRLVYSKSYAEVDAAAHDIWEMINAKRAVLPGNVAVGFDLEWKASFQRGGVPGKVAVVQLCLESSRCDVMQIVHSGIPPLLATFLEDPSIVKTGIGSRGDASKLRSDYGIQTRGVIDLSEMANQKLGRWQSWSLSSLAEELTCKKVEKVSSIRCGDWEACPLSSPQLQYAATDAFASLYLYQILETFSNHALKNEESSSDSPLMQQPSNEL